MVYLDAEKKFSDWGFAIVELVVGAGDTIEPDLDLFKNVNYNSNVTHGTLKVKHYRYEHYLFDKQLTVLIGKINTRNYFDKSVYAGDDDTQFLSWVFNKSAAIEWPSSSYTFGIHVDIAPEFIEFLDLEFNYFEGDADWVRIFSQGIYTAQVKVNTAALLQADPEQWDGNCRVYGWINSRHHSKLIAATDSQQDSDDKEVNWGFGLSLDQMITDVFGLFGRIGWQRPDLVPASGGVTAEWAWSFGGQMKGKYWKREDDILGIAIGQVLPSKRYKKEGNPAGVEGHLEAYYNWQIGKHIRIGPSVQLVWNPDGVGQADPVFVYGFRTHWVF